MQTTTAAFDARARADVRKLAFGCTIAFAKEFDEDIQFFTIGVSEIGGTDLIPGTGSVVQSWDRYQYIDYTHRLLGIEWSRQEEPVSSVAMAMADITLDNHDNYFSADNFALPSRPVRLYAGFGDETIPVFVGLTEKLPNVDDKNKVVKFHCVDFLAYLFDKKIDETIVLTNVTTDQVLDELLQVVGLLPTQYELDNGFNLIPFVYFDKEDKFGDAVRKLMEAEQGRVFMDEQGVIRFKNRQNYGDTPVWSFTRSTITDLQPPKQDDIINVVAVNSEVREVQSLQKIWSSSQPIFIRAGTTQEVWAEFEDPAISVDTPTLGAALYSSGYLVNTYDDGGGVSLSISLDSFDVFGKSAKIVFENTDTVDGFVTIVELFGTPAKVVRKIQIKEQDDTSIALYDEQPFEINSDLIQTEGDAISRALVLLDDYSTFSDVLEQTVKGTPALQLGDLITNTARERTYVVKTGDSLSAIAAAYGVSLPTLLANNPQFTNPSVIHPGDIVYFNAIPEEYRITKIDSSIMDGRFKQVLGLKQFIRRSYFTIGVSSIGGTDVLAP